MRTAEDRLLDRIEAAEIQNYAIRQRRELGWEGFERVDPLAVMSVRDIWTVRGRAPFEMRVVDDDDFMGRPGHTKLEGSCMVARIQEGTRRKAFFGGGYARFLVAKEIGHATLRHPEMKTALLEKYRERLIQGDSEARRTMVSAACSMEFQASVLAASLLIGQNAVPNASPEDLSVKYGIDTLTARVFFTEIQSAGSRP